jgi:hypothetical protein
MDLHPVGLDHPTYEASGDLDLHPVGLDPTYEAAGDLDLPMRQLLT